MNDREMIEALHREDALLRITELVKRYGITRAGLAAALPNRIPAAIAPRRRFLIASST